MPKTNISVTKNELDSMGVRIFSDVDSEFQKNGIRGDFLCWMISVKKVPENDWARVCENPGELMEEYDRYRDEHPIGDLLGTPDEQREAAEQLTGRPILNVDMTDPEAMRFAAPWLKIYKMVLDKAAELEPKTSEIRENADRFNKIYDTIREGYTVETLQEKGEKDSWLLRNPENTLQKRYVLDGLGGLSLMEAEALLNRRKMSAGVGKSKDKATEIEAHFRGQKDGYEKSAKDFLMKGGRSKAAPAIDGTAKVIKPAKKKPETFDIDTTTNNKIEIDDEIITTTVKKTTQEEIGGMGETGEIVEFGETGETGETGDTPDEFDVEKVEAKFRKLEQEEKRAREELEARAREARASLPERKRELPRNYDSYRVLHTGYFAVGHSREKMLQALTRTFASYYAEKDGQPFDPDTIHRYESRAKTTLLLDALSTKDIETILMNDDSIKDVAMARETRLYGVPQDKRISYVANMKVLKASVDQIIADDPSHVTPEYQRFADAVKAASELDPLTASETDYMVANHNLRKTIVKYQKNRKSMRRNHHKQDRFDSTLNALGIISRESNHETKAWIEPIVHRINEVRGYKKGDISGENSVQLSRYGTRRIKRFFDIDEAEIKENYRAEIEERKAQLEERQSIRKEPAKQEPAKKEPGKQGPHKK